jgi:hypothetical protein
MCEVLQFNGRGKWQWARSPFLLEPHTDFYVVYTVPVNYAIQFSGPVTTFTARHVWYGVGMLRRLILTPPPAEIFTPKLTSQSLHFGCENDSFACL